MQASDEERALGLFLNCVDTKLSDECKIHAACELTVFNANSHLDEVKALLRTEKILRLDPLTQIEYALPGQLSTELTNQLQLRVVREAGLPDEAVDLIRSAQYLFPDEPDMREIPHYVKYNRSKTGLLTIGTKAPSASV